MGSLRLTRGRRDGAARPGPTALRATGSAPPNWPPHPPPLFSSLLTLHLPYSFSDLFPSPCSSPSHLRLLLIFSLLPPSSRLLPPLSISSISSAPPAPPVLSSPPSSLHLLDLFRPPLYSSLSSRSPFTFTSPSPQLLLNLSSLLPSLYFFIVPSLHPPGPSPPAPPLVVWLESWRSPVLQEQEQTHCLRLKGEMLLSTHTLFLLCIQSQIGRAPCRERV